MTIYSSIYTSLTGLSSFSTALNAISDNVANLNTPGFKANNVLFRDLGPKASDADQINFGGEAFSVGDGVAVRGTLRSFTQGDFQTTGNATDLAIEGDSFFVLRQGGELTYSRAGQFTFDEEGFLIDPVTEDRVQGIDTDGLLTDIQVDRDMERAAVPTATIPFTGILSTGSSEIPTLSATVIDSAGSSRMLSVNFSPNTDPTSNFVSWLVTVTDEQENPLVDSQEIRFNGDGTPVDGFNTLTAMLPVGENSTSIALNFGTPNSSDGVTSLSAGTISTIATGTIDGSAGGVLTEITIDRQGIVQLAFSDQGMEIGQQIALANFANPQSLEGIGNSRFEVVSEERIDQPTFGSALDQAFGPVRSGGIELANVDLSQEFVNIIVLQRAFQGSSEVLNISSQLLDQLYNNLGVR